MFARLAHLGATVLSPPSSYICSRRRRCCRHQPRPAVKPDGTVVERVAVPRQGSGCADRLVPFHRSSSPAIDRALGRPFGFGADERTPGGFAEQLAITRALPFVGRLVCARHLPLLCCAGTYRLSDLSRLTLACVCRVGYPAFVFRFCFRPTAKWCAAPCRTWAASSPELR